MPWSLDVRIPVHLGAPTPPADGDALLIEGTPAPSAHPAESFTADPAVHAPGCACCVARSPAALALDRLFQRRVRGEIPHFRRVFALTSTPEGDMAVWAALRDDPVAAARYRLER